MTDCIFCKIIKGVVPSEILFQDDQICVIRDIRPKAAVHLLVLSKEHISSLKETNPTHANLLSHMLLILPKIAELHGLDKGFRTVINTGSGGGQEIDHIHFHLLGGGPLPKF